MKEINYKIHFDLGHGTIEIEGSEKFVIEQFEPLKKLLLESKGMADVKPGRKRKTKTKVSRRVSIKKEVDLKASGKTPSLLKFYDQARRPTFLSRSLLFLYYLKNIKGHEKINTAHLKACYNAVKATQPSNIYQNVIVGGGKKNWVDVSDTKDLKLTTAGAEEVEKVLLAPEKRATKKKKAKPARKKTRARKKAASAKKKEISARKRTAKVKKAAV
jgi:hypothetical protein